MRSYDKDVWSKQIAFYLDGVGFVYKRNPMDQALAPRGRVWRKKVKDFHQGVPQKGVPVELGGIMFTYW